MVVKLRPGLERAREEGGAPVPAPPRAPSTIAPSTIAPSTIAPPSAPVSTSPSPSTQPGALFPAAPLRGGAAGGGLSPLALRLQGPATTRAIDARLSQMVDTKRFVKKDDAAGEAAAALRTVAMLQSGASPAVARLVGAARQDAESYARGAPIDPLPSFAALAAVITPSSPVHEREMKAHLALAIAAAARSLAVHDPDGPHALVAEAIAPFGA